MHENKLRNKLGFSYWNTMSPILLMMVMTWMTMIWVCTEMPELELHLHALQNGFEVALVSCSPGDNGIIISRLTTFFCIISVPWYLDA